MLDWNDNGRIDAGDHYIFHEMILQDDSENNNSEYGRTSVGRNVYEKKEVKPKKKEEVSVYEIIFKVLVVVVILFGLLAD